MTSRISATAPATERLTKVAQLLLGAIAAAAVVDFGGVQPAVFLPMGMAVVVLAAAVLWQTGWPRLSLPATCVLAALVLVPALQLAPLPLGLVKSLSPARAALHNSLTAPLLDSASRATLTVAPHATWLALLKLVAYALVFVLAFQFARSARGSLLVPVLLAIGLFEAIFGLYQYLARSPWIFNRMLPASVAQGTYINRNNYAGLLAMILPLLAARIALGFSDRHGRGRPRWHAATRTESGAWLLWLLAFVVIFLGMLFSESRGGILAGIAGVIAASFVVLARRSRRASALVLIVVFGAPLLYGAWIGLDPIFGRFEAAETGAAARFLIWKDTVPLIRDYPLFGAGFGAYPWASLHYQTGMLEYRYDHAHNDYLEFTSEAGVPLALLLFGSLWFLAFRVARGALLKVDAAQRSLAAGCAGSTVAVLLHCLVDFDLQMPASALLFAWVVGTAVALAEREEVSGDSVRLFASAPGR